MCGIAGKINFNHLGVDGDEIEEMLDVMNYRGPDSRGVFIDDGIGLGHLRLSIIDLSNEANQPFFNEDKSICLVYNGEIFNYIEIKNELKTKGHKFLTTSDTEVLLRSYIEWGEKCLNKFNGMWAFVLWDKKKNLFFGARDRFGIKPLYYKKNKKSFVFASEIKAILKEGKKSPSPNLSHFYDFFDRQIKVGDDTTLFEGVNILLPGHYFILKNGRMDIRRFYQFDERAFKNKYDYSNPVSKFRELLIDAVKLRLRSDVPVGVCLSGGLDSTVVAGIISEILGVRPKTFSVVYNEENFFEGNYIDRAIEYYNTSAQKIFPGYENFFDVVNKLIEHLDEPVQMPGLYSQWHVMECAKREVTVTLDGQGADELLGGYFHYFPFYIATLLKNFFILKNPHESALKIIEHLNGIKNIHQMSQAHYIKSALKIVLGLSKDKSDIKNSIFTDDIKNMARSDEREERLFHSLLNGELYRTFVATNLPMLLKYEDRMSMAFSLEARVPFLDYRVVEFCFGLDDEYKINGSKTKWILREAFKDILPEQVYNRSDKKGFPTPIEMWLKRENLFKGLKEILLSDKIKSRGVFDIKEVEKMLIEHFEGRANHYRTIWRILTTELWFNKYFD